MPNDAYKVTWLVRRLFRAMAERADRYLADAGLSAADRAVMEFLYPGEAMTVPELARRYQVSRQHVQVTANRLLDQGLLAVEPNPRHKRSSLMVLSEAGRDTFRSIREHESALLDDVFADIEIADIATTRRTLATLLHKLNEETHDE